MLKQLVQFRDIVSELLEKETRDVAVQWDPVDFEVTSESTSDDPTSQRLAVKIIQVKPTNLASGDEA